MEAVQQSGGRGGQKVILAEKNNCNCIIEEYNDGKDHEAD
jgi:hypothetical protein